MTVLTKWQTLITRPIRAKQMDSQVRSLHEKRSQPKMEQIAAHCLDVKGSSAERTVRQPSRPQTQKGEWTPAMKGYLDCHAEDTTGIDGRTSQSNFDRSDNDVKKNAGIPASSANSTIRKDVSTYGSIMYTSDRTAIDRITRFSRAAWEKLIKPPNNRSDGLWWGLCQVNPATTIMAW
jgi:hypothetical protein